MDVIVGRANESRAHEVNQTPICFYFYSHCTTVTVVHLLAMYTDQARVRITEIIGFQGRSLRLKFIQTL